MNEHLDSIVATITAATVVAALAASVFFAAKAPRDEVAVAAANRNTHAAAVFALVSSYVNTK